MRLNDFNADFKNDWQKGPRITLIESSTKMVTLKMDEDWQVRELYQAARTALVARRDMHSKAMTEMNDLLDAGH